MANKPKPKRNHQVNSALCKATTAAVLAGLSVDLIEIDRDGKILLHTSKAVATSEVMVAA